MMPGRKRHSKKSDKLFRIHPVLFFGLFFSLGMVILLLIPSPSGSKKTEYNCEVCQKLRRTKAALTDGTISRADAIGRELTIFASEYHHNRPLKLEERRGLIESGQGSPEDLLEVKRDIAHNRFLLGTLEAAEYRRVRTSLINTYKTLLDQKIATGEIDTTERHRILDSMELR